jgi:hypothetical protein
MCLYEMTKARKQHICLGNVDIAILPFLGPQTPAGILLTHFSCRYILKESQFVINQSILYLYTYHLGATKLVKT